MSHDNIERAREANEGAHPEDRIPVDEDGDFSVRVVYLDGVDRTHGEPHTSLIEALRHADEHRAYLRTLNYDRTRVNVSVIDNDDPERGALDWEVLD